MELKLEQLIKKIKIYTSLFVNSLLLTNIIRNLSLTHTSIRDARYCRYTLMGNKCAAFLLPPCSQKNLTLSMSWVYKIQLMFEFSYIVFPWCHLLPELRMTVSGSGDDGHHVTISCLGWWHAGSGQVLTSITRQECGQLGGCQLMSDPMTGSSRNSST